MSITNFKYKIAYKCKNQEEALELVDKLKKIGYELSLTPTTTYYEYNDTCQYLCTKWNSRINGYGFGSKNWDRELIDNPELFLALAAMRDSDEFFKGEWVYILGTDFTKGNPHFPLGELFRIENTDQQYKYVDSTSNPKVTGTCTSDVRKATKEELVAYFTKEVKENIKEEEVNKKLKNQLAIKGDRVLLEALAIKFVELGLTPNIDTGKYDWLIWNKDSTVYLRTYTNGEYAYHSHYSSYSEVLLELPQDWNKALELAAEVEKVELEVGKWYKHQSAVCRVDSLDGSYPKGTGVSILGSWGSGINMYNGTNDWKPATEEEIEAVLTKEANKRGFVKGVKVNQLAFGSDYKNQWTVNSHPANYIYSEDELGVGGIIVYKQGKWADILPSYSVGDWVLLSRDGNNGLNKDSIVQLMEVDDDKKPTGELRENADFMFKSPKYTISKYLRTKASSIKRLATKEEIKKASTPEYVKCIEKTSDDGKHTRVNGVYKVIELVPNFTYNNWYRIITEQGKYLDYFTTSFVEATKEEYTKYQESIKAPYITINGYQAVFKEDYVEFGCAKLSKHFIHELYESLVELNESAKELANTNRTLNSVKLGVGEFTIGQIKQIKEYYSK